jgi:hypothetical protein
VQLFSGNKSPVVHISHRSGLELEQNIPVGVEHESELPF